MSKEEAYATDPESLRYKSLPELMDIIEMLISIIKDQDETISIQSAAIEALKD